MRRTAIWIPAGIVVLLMLPMVVTRRSFGHDWTLHLWMIRQQQLNIEAMGHPGLFVSAKPLGAFYPVFAFVGSGVYAVGGYLAIVLGNRPIVAYKLLYFAGLCIAYGGFTWLSLQFGLRRWRAQVPGAVLVTGAYFVTDMAGRGDLGEFMALAAIPMVLAAICAVVTAPEYRLRHGLGVVLGLFLLTGSHNITLLWGSVFVGLLGLLVAVAWGSTWRRPLPWRRVGRLVALGAIGVGLNAWFLFPDLAYGLDTLITTVNQKTKPDIIFVHATLLLNPLRPTDHSPSIDAAFSRDVRLSFPCLFFAWVAVVAVLVWRGRDHESKRFFLLLLDLTGAFALFVVAIGPWFWLPRFFWNVQFTWRLDAYVLIGAALLVMVVLRWQAETRGLVRRSTSVALVAIVAFNVGVATWQVWRVRSEYVKNPRELPTDSHFDDQVVADRYAIPPSWYADPRDFRDGSAPVVAVTRGRTATVPLTAVSGSKFSGTLRVPTGPAPFATNISASPRFVRMTGIRAVGRTRNGLVVAVRAADSPAAGPVAVTIRPARSALLRAGDLVSLLSVVALLGLLVWPARRLWR